MSVQCFIDLFDSSRFRGGRRRIFGPVRLDAHVLGLDGKSDVSVRVGSQAALKIERAGGEEETLQGGEQVETLETGRIQWIEVKPSES